MQKVLASLSLITALTLATGAHAQQSTSRSFYDQRGSFAGSSVTRGNATSFSDRSGHFAGRAIKHSNGTTSFYDRNGRFTGSTTDTTPRR